MLMRVLDAGVYGIICPMINSRAEAEAFVQACRYPPSGNRSYGPTRAALYSGEDYFSSANGTVLTLAKIETSQALDSVDEIAATPGLDGIYVGPVDLSISLGLGEKVDFDHARLREALDKILRAAKANRLVTGIHTFSTEDVARLANQGFQLLTPATDTTLLRIAAGNVLEQTRQAM